MNLSKVIGNIPRAMKTSKRKLDASDINFLEQKATKSDPRQRLKKSSKKRMQKASRKANRK